MKMKITLNYGLNKYLKTNNMDNETEYADRLIEKHNIINHKIRVNGIYTMTHYQIINSAIQDVENTIEALNLITLTLDNHSIVKYYKNVLQILKDKL